MYFPHPLLADEDGLLAVGGDLSVERLSLAYSSGIFPWFNQQPILWWFTHPRSVVYPDSVKISKSMSSLIYKKRPWQLTLNHSFNDVIYNCSIAHRKDQESTWISDEMIDAYSALHHMNLSHSVEVWSGTELIGGLYGVLIGEIFFGESMFSKVPNSSKYAFIHLCQYLDYMGVRLIDCQQDTAHMRSLGAKLISKDEFWKIIRSNNLKKTINIDSLSFIDWMSDTY